MRLKLNIKYNKVHEGDVGIGVAVERLIANKEFELMPVQSDYIITIYTKEN